jgi:endonuclease G
MLRSSLTLALLLVCTAFGGSQQLKVVDKGHYKVGYSEQFRAPVWVEYVVMCTEGKYSRKGLDFYPETGVQTSIDADYYNNEWDKGHMAPAADFACDSLALRSTFSYVNCALQQEGLNRGPWRLLEVRERQLADSFPVFVRIDVEFKGEPRAMPSGARVPSGFKKTLWYTSHEEVYAFENSRPSSNDIKRYLIFKK